jgi:glycosyltransferase involved in cell wall biosynthesis
LKVLFVTTDSFIDHSYTIALELRKKIDLRVFILAKKKTEEIRRWCNDLNAEFVERKRYRNPLNIYYQFKFILKLSKLEANKICFNALNLYQAILAKLLLRNIIVIFHDVDPHPDSKDYFSIFTNKITLRLYKQNVCTVSKTQAGIFQRIFGFEPDVMQLPLIDYYQKVSPIEKKETEKRPSKIKFFFFGTINPYKGIETLIEAAGILSRRNADFKLSIIGKINYNREEIGKKILENKNIELIDKYIDYKEVSRIFRENDVIILPYKQVTQCGPLLISYDAGIPCICNDLTGFREYVDDGKSGFLFNKTSENLADIMQYIISNPEIINEQSKYIRKIIREKFSVHSLLNIYIDILSRK